MNTKILQDGYGFLEWGDGNMLYLYNTKEQGGRTMFAVRLPPDLETRLQDLAHQTGRTKSYYATKAIRAFLEDEEDYRLALARLEEHHPRIPLESIERELDG